MKAFSTSAWLVLLVSILIACKKEKKNDDDPKGTTDYSSGIYIVNEGNFKQGNGSVSHFNRDTKAVKEDLFSEVNGRPLGDVVQSMLAHEGKGYIVVNNSQKVEVVNLKDFKSTGTITGLKAPRYCLGVNTSKIYVSDWVDNNIKVFNTSSLAKTKTIITGAGPEEMLLYNNKVYVACSGGFGKDSVILVISPLIDDLLSDIRVGINPKAIKADANNMLWVLCSGDYGATNDPNDDSPAELVKIDPLAEKVEARFIIGKPGDHPQRLAISKDKKYLYYDNNGIYKFPVNDTVLPAQPLIKRSSYGLDVDPATDNIHVGNAMNFSQKGYMVRYSSTGTLIDSVKVGLIPGGFTFK